MFKQKSYELEKIKDQQRRQNTWLSWGDAKGFCQPIFTSGNKQM